MSDLSTQHVPQVMERRLPVYLLLDCSGSMAGEPIEALQMGIGAFVSSLMGDPQALETVWLSVITFDSTAEQIVPLVDIAEFEVPQLEPYGTTALGEAMMLLVECIDMEARKTTEEQKGDWRPVVFLFTDGEPTDAWQDPVRTFRDADMANLVVCGAGPSVKNETLKQISNTVIRLQDTHAGTLISFMDWVTQAVTSASHSLGTSQGVDDTFPDLPTDQGISLVP